MEESSGTKQNSRAFNLNFNLWNHSECYSESDVRIVLSYAVVVIWLSGLARDGDRMTTPHMAGVIFATGLQGEVIGTGREHRAGTTHYLYVSLVIETE